MAKDPAFLFYPGDWLGGTLGMSFEEKGAYLELLVLQWNCHRITNDAAKRLVGEELWHRISHKFSADGNGFFNERLETEKIKRRKHSEKQSDNANKRWAAEKSGNATALPLEDEDENENRNENKDRGVGKGFFKPDENYSVELSEMDTGKAIEYISHTKHISATKELVSGLWGAFKVKNFTGEKTYKNDRDIIRHFFESLKFVVLNEKRVTKTNKSVGKTIEFDKP